MLPFFAGAPCSRVQGVRGKRRKKIPGEIQTPEPGCRHRRRGGFFRLLNGGGHMREGKMKQAGPRGKWGDRIKKDSKHRIGKTSNRKSRRKTHFGMEIAGRGWGGSLSCRIWLGGQ